MKRQLLLATIVAFTVGLPATLSAYQSESQSATESRYHHHRTSAEMRKSSVAARDSISEGTHAAANSARHGVIRTERTLAHGAKATGRTLEAVGERTASTSETAMEKIGSPFRALGRTMYHLVSPEADLNVPWSNQRESSSSRTRVYRD